MNIWRLITHHENPDDALTWARENKRIAIGWGLIGDIAQQQYESASDIGAAIRREYPQLSNSGDGGPSLWQFYAEIQPGDYVILGKRPSQLVVVVTGGYEWLSESDELLGDYQHQRNVRITARDAVELWKKAGGKPAEGQSPRSTLIRCINQLDPYD